MATETTGLLSQQESSKPPNRTSLILVAAISCIVGVTGGYFLRPLFLCDKGGRATTPTTATQHKYPRSRYTATQFISFSINTLGGVSEYGECDGRVVDENGYCYIGNDGDMLEDVMHRYNVLKEVLHTIKADSLNEFPEIDHSDHVLKIFMLPEFYWRGPNGAYSTQQLREDGALIKMSDKMRKLIQHDAFENFLFVMGTVVLATSPDDPAAPWEQPDQVIEEGEVLYFNIAPVYKGGVPKDGQDNAFFVTKKYISTADFLNRESGLPDPRTNHISEYSDINFDAKLMEYITNERNVTIADGGVFEMDGVRIGLEICLDHRLSVLWKNLQKTNGDLLDVLLVVSAGMSIERGPSPLRPGGVSYLTDGEASSAACRRMDNGEYDPAVVCRDRHNDGPQGLRHVPVGGEGYSSYIELATCLNPDDAPWKPLITGYYSDHATQGCAFTLKMHGIDVYDEYSFYDPSVEIYPTIDLP